MGVGVGGNYSRKVLNRGTAIFRGNTVFCFLCIVAVYHKSVTVATESTVTESLIFSWFGFYCSFDFYSPCEKVAANCNRGVWG